MTRQEFVDNYDYIGDLVNFAFEYGCEHIIENVYSEDSMDDLINEYYLQDWARNNGWRSLLDILSDLPTGSDWYYTDDYGNWYAVGSTEEDEYKSEILEWCDDNGIWDGDEEDEDDDDFEYCAPPRIGQPAVPQAPQEDFDTDGIFDAVIDPSIVSVSEKLEEQRRAAEEAERLRHEAVVAARERRTAEAEASVRREQDAALEAAGLIIEAFAQF